MKLQGIILSRKSETYRKHKQNLTDEYSVVLVYQH